MASTFNNILFIILFVSVIINIIDGYPLHQLNNIEDLDDDDNNNNNNDDDLTSNHKINFRSVLWPKICFTTLIKKTDHQQMNDQIQLSTRNTRKCYPFETA